MDKNVVDLTALFAASRTPTWTARDLKAMARSLRTNGERGDKAGVSLHDSGPCLHDGQGV